MGAYSPPQTATLHREETSSNVFNFPSLTRCRLLRELTSVNMPRNSVAKKQEKSA